MNERYHKNFCRCLMPLVMTVMILSCLIMTEDSHAGKLKVIASIAPLADFAGEVGGDKVEVQLLLPPGASPHIFEPTPRAIRDVSAAGVFVKIGAGFEFWAEKIINTSGNRNLAVVDASEGMPLIREPASHGATAPDPHIWLDPTMAVEIVSKIEKALTGKDPRNAGYYRKNASRYSERLLALDREIWDKVRTFRIKEYITFHPAWSYFSRRYGLRVAGVIEESPGKEPSPRHIERIIRDIRRIGSKVVFVEPQFNPKIAEVIAKESGAHIAYLDPIGGQDGRRTYIDMMRYNISELERAMK